MSLEELVEALLEGFAKSLNAEVYVDELSERELEAASKLVDKYRDPGWVFKR